MKQVSVPTKGCHFFPYFSLEYCDMFFVQVLFAIYDHLCEPFCARVLFSRKTQWRNRTHRSIPSSQPPDHDSYVYISDATPSAIFVGHYRDFTTRLCDASNGEGFSIGSGKPNIAGDWFNCHPYPYDAKSHLLCWELISFEDSDCS